MLGLTEADPLEGFSHRLSAMVRDGQLLRNRRGSYGVPSEMSLVAGRVLAHKDGFGFLTPDDGGGDLPEPNDGVGPVRAAPTPQGTLDGGRSCGPRARTAGSAFGP